MATFRFPGRNINIHWNGYDIKGPAGTVFSIPDQLYEEFEGDIRPVEPSLEWIETNEFDALESSVSAYTLEAAAPITISPTSTGRSISFSSGTAQNGALLAADGSGGVIYIPASTSGINSVIGVTPISAAISGGIVSVSLDASYSSSTHNHSTVYQPLGTYVTGVVGTSPISASGTTSVTVTIDQAAITGATAATNAQTVRTYVKNTTGSTIGLGKAVYVSGATGDNALISLATASTEIGSSKTLGITAESIANDAFGYVVESGYLSGIDTTGVSAGSSVWLGTTPGSLVFGAPPAEPNHSVYLGVVIREQQNNGTILVKVQNGYELDELHDVSAASPSDGDIIQYKNSSGLWTKASIANAGIAASVHTHDYQASGTYINAVIGTSPASVSTASGTSTVSIIAGSIDSTHLSSGAVTTANISSGAATNGQVLTSNGSGGVTFTTPSSGITATGTTQDNAIARWDGTTASAIQNSGVVISDSADVFFGGAVASVPITVSANTANVYNIDLSLSNHFILTNTTTSSAPVVVATATTSFGSSTSGSATMPSGLQQNDYVLLAVGSDGATSITCSTAGFDRVAWGSPGTAGYALFLKKMGASPDATAAVAGLATASGAVAVGIRSTSGLSVLSGLHSSGAVPNPPSVNTLQNNTLVAAVGFLDDQTTAFTSPTGYSTMATAAISGSFVIGICTKTVATAGTEDPGQFGGPSGDEGVGFTAVFAPSAPASVALINSPTTSVNTYGTANAYSALIEYSPSSNGISWDSKISWPSGGQPPATSSSSVIIYTSNGGTTFKGSYVSGY